MSSLSGYGLNVWMPSVLMRSFGLDIRATANFLGSAFLIGGCVCIYAGGWLADRLGGDRGWYAKLPAVAWLITAPLFVAGLLAPNLWVAWAPLMIASGLCILWQAPLAAAVQHLVPRDMRVDGGRVLFADQQPHRARRRANSDGHFSDALKASHGADALRYAAVACTAFLSRGRTPRVFCRTASQPLVG